MNIYQVLVTLSYGDGVGNDTLAIDKLLKEMGHETKIFAQNIDKRISSQLAKTIDKIPDLCENDIVIYHLSTGADLNNEVKNWKCKLIFKYHNITPSHFFEKYNNHNYELCEIGINQIKQLNLTPNYCIVDSDFNKADLQSYGYKCEIDVLPILIPFDDYKTSPDEGVISKYSDGWVNIIFVGRIAPNKKQEDVISAFAYYKTYVNPKSRLILVGAYDINDEYYNKLVNYINTMKVEDIMFTGHTKFDQILAYYSVANVFLCMSEHEGFCIPLIEAMHFDVPIIAFSTTAIPYTMQRKGVLIDNKNPAFVAKLIDKIIKNVPIKNYIISEQNEIIKEYKYEKIKDRFIFLLNKFIEENK